MKERVMDAQLLFAISIMFSFVAWSIVTVQFIWPWLHAQPRTEALRPLLILHSFRFIGLAFLVPGVVSPDLPTAFAQPAAYGDLIAAVLALIALAALKSRAGLGATFFIPTLIVPVLLITHGLMFRILLQRDTTN
jgi:hypothetical protein